MKYLPFAVFMFALLCGSHAAHAQYMRPGNLMPPTRERLVPFGGKVVATTVPAVNCSNTSGTVPVVLSTNLASLVSVGTTAADRQQQGGEKAVRIAEGVYGALPLYFRQFSSRPQPKQGDWILGMHRIVPDVSTCKLQAGNVAIPFPVKETWVYGTSR